MYTIYVVLYVYAHMYILHLCVCVCMCIAHCASARQGEGSSCIGHYVITGTRKKQIEFSSGHDRGATAAAQPELPMLHWYTTWRRQRRRRFTARGEATQLGIHTHGAAHGQASHQCDRQVALEIPPHWFNESSAFFFHRLNSCRCSNWKIVYGNYRSACNRPSANWTKAIRSGICATSVWRSLVKRTNAALQRCIASLRSWARNCAANSSIS